MIIYAVERSLASYKFNLLHNKQLFINQLKTNSLGSRTIDEGGKDEDTGMNFSEYVAVLSGNTDLLEKAKLDKKITALESERKNFNRERDQASNKLTEIEGKQELHTARIGEAKNDPKNLDSRIEKDKDGNIINKLTIKGVEGETDVEKIAERLHEIEEKARTDGHYQKIGDIYGFPIVVKTESSMKDLFSYSNNRFLVKGESGIYYTHNNGKLASDPKLATQNFLSALGHIPRVIEGHEKELAKAVSDISVYTAIANGSWRKEDELRELKSQASELDRKIAATLFNKPDEKEGEQQGQETKHEHSANDNKQSFSSPQSADKDNDNDEPKEEQSASRGVRRRW